MKRDGWNAYRKNLQWRHLLYKRGLLFLAILALLVFSLFFGIVVSAHGQMVSVKAFPGSSMAQKLANAQDNGCLVSSLTCVLMIEPELNVFSEGTLPNRCANCWWIDYRSTGGLRLGVGAGNLLALIPGVTVGPSIQVASCTGATADAQINDCVSKLPATGGLLDATGLLTSATAGDIVLSKPVKLLLPWANPALALGGNKILITSPGAGLQGGGSSVTVLTHSGAGLALDATTTAGNNNVVLQGFSITQTNDAANCFKLGNSTQQDIVRDVECFGSNTASNTGIGALLDATNATAVFSGQLKMENIYMLGYKFPLKVMGGNISTDTWTTVTCTNCRFHGRAATHIPGSIGAWFTNTANMTGSAFLGGSIEANAMAIQCDAGAGSVCNGINFDIALEGNDALWSVPTSFQGHINSMNANGMFTAYANNPTTPWNAELRQAGSWYSDNRNNFAWTIYDDSGNPQSITFNRGAGKATGGSPTQKFIFSLGLSGDSGCVNNYFAVFSNSARLCSLGANLFSVVNGTTGQAVDVYGTYTDASNYRYAEIAGNVSAGHPGLACIGAGTGANPECHFYVNGADRWKIGANGELQAITDNTQDFGALASARPRTGYFGTSVVTPTFNVTTTEQWNGQPVFVYVSSNFTTAANTNLQNITGLTWTMPGSLAINVPFDCYFQFSQATAVAAVSFGIQDVTTAPTQINSNGTMGTSATASAFGPGVLALASTTATAILTGTPSAITTVWPAEIHGVVEQPSGTASAINIMVKTATSGDAVTVYRGSFCRIGPK